MISWCMSHKTREMCRRMETAFNMKVWKCFRVFATYLVLTFLLLTGPYGLSACILYYFENEVTDTQGTIRFISRNLPYDLPMCYNINSDA